MEIGTTELILIGVVLGVIVLLGMASKPQKNPTYKQYHIPMDTGTFQQQHTPLEIELEKLSSLHQRGLIDDEEYKVQRQKLINKY